MERSDALVIVRAASLPPDVAVAAYLADDTFAFCGRLVAERPWFAYALGLAAPGLWSSLVRSFPLVPTMRDVQSMERLRITLLRYVVRAATRATPYGLFAGTAFAADDGGGEREPIILPADWHFAARLDSTFAERLAHASGAERSFAVNELCRVRGDRVALFELRPADGEASRPLRSIRRSEFVDALLRFPCVRTGAEWTASVTRAFSCSPEDASETVAALVDAGLLLEQPVVPVVADSYWNTGDNVPVRIGELEHGLAQLSAGDDVASVFALASQLAGDGVADTSRTTIQCDAFGSYRGRVPRDVVRDGLLLRELMLRFSGRFGLREYRERFARAYEGDTRLVPFLDVYERLGPCEDPVAVDSTARMKRRAEHLARLLADAAREGAREIVLDDGDIDALSLREASDVRDLEGEVGVEWGTFAGEGPWVRTAGVVASDGLARISGRFLHLAPDHVRRHVDGVTGRRPSQVELVVFPADARAINVARRARTPRSELQIGLVLPGAKRRLTLEDVFLTLERDRFAVVDADGNAMHLAQRHMLATPMLPEIAQSLVTIAFDGNIAVRAFDWGDLRGARCTPRLRYRGIVLAPARWSLDAHAKDGDAVRADVEALRRLGLPRRAWLVPGSKPDSRLFVDLDAADALRLVAQERRGGTVTFEEHAESCIFDDSGARRAAEIVIGVPGKVEDRGTGRRAVRVQPVYPPGSEWTTLILRASRFGMDELVRDAVPGLLAAARARPGASRWHFVRYADAAPHLRMRVEAVATPSGMLDALAGVARELGCNDIAFETFRPEYERYGGPEALDALLVLFEHSSEAALADAASLCRTSQEKRNAVAARSLGALVGGWLERAGTVDWSTIRPRVRGSGAALVAAVESGLADASRAPRQLAAAVDRAVAALGDAAGHAAVFRAVCHMHCNRYGVDAANERQIVGTLFDRYAYLRRAAPRVVSAR